MQTNRIKKSQIKNHFNTFQQNMFRSDLIYLSFGSISSMLPKNQLRLLTLVRLMKLFLFISKFQTQGDKSIIIGTNDNAILIKKELQEEMTSINNDKVTFLNVSQQHDIYICGVHIINHFHSIL